MTRLGILFTVFLAASACNKPEPEDCRKALQNMEKLMGTDNLSTPATLEGEVRRCRGGSSKEAVQCAIKATTLDELHACNFYKTGPKAPAAGSGSAK